MNNREKGIEEIADILRGQHNQKRQKVKEYASEVGMKITLPDEEEQDFRGMAERAIDAEIVRLAVKSLKEKLNGAGGSLGSLIGRIDIAGGAQDQFLRQQYDQRLAQSGARKEGS